VFDVFYSHFSHQHVSAAIAAIFRVMLLLKEYKGTSVVTSVPISPKQLKIIRISVKIM
jgi:hypothetical protein